MKPVLSNQPAALILDVFTPFQVTVIITVGAVLIAFVICFCIWGVRPSFLIPAGDPVVAYKRAYVLPAAGGGGSHSGHWTNRLVRYGYTLAGVNCQGYKSNDVLAHGTSGFHAYKDYDDAVRHDQHGNVLLEVLLYGKVHSYELGYISTNQRVLQVLVKECGDNGCQGRPEYYEQVPGQYLNFYCREHAHITVRKSVGFFARLFKLSPQEFGDRTSPMTSGRIEDLGDVLPWVKSRNVVATGVTRSVDSFKPTVIGAKQPQEHK